MPRAVQLKEHGSPSKTLEIVEVPKPQAGQGEVVIRMKLRPVNPSDVYSILGVYPGYNQGKIFPAVPGLEGMGVIDSVGAGVSQFQSGQRVVPLFFLYAKDRAYGSWQDYVVIKQDDVVGVPDNIPDESAAQLIINPLTVIGLLKKLEVPKGQYIAQTAAASTLGRMLIPVARHLNIKTVNLVRRESQIPELKALGADVVICTEGKSPQDIANEIKTAAGGPVYGAVDAVAGKAALALSLSVRDGGWILNYGMMEGTEASISAVDALFRGIIFTGYWVTSEFLKSSKEAQKAWIQETFDLMGKGIMVPFHGERYKLEDVKEAVKKSGEAGRGGKVLLES